MNSIVVGYTGSEQADRVLLRAAGLAESLSASLIVVSVAPSGARTVSPEPDSPRAPDAIEGLIVPGHRAATAGAAQQAEEVHSRHQLERARATLAGHPLDVDYLIEVGDPAARLIAVAAEHESDMIVVGHGEHGFLERLVRPSVDEAVSRHPICDVLLVH